jgi:hypothetical protein
MANIRETVNKRPEYLLTASSQKYPSLPHSLALSLSLSLSGLLTLILGRTLRDKETALFARKSW